jgi:PAS domain S-box-containing protein
VFASIAEYGQNGTGTTAVPDMPRSVKAYSLSILFVAIAFFLNRTLHAITLAPPFATFLWAVILSAWFAGTGPAILAMIASTILVDYFLFPPIHQLAVSPADLLRMALFLATSSIITLLASRERRQSRKLTSILDGMSDAFLSVDRDWNLTRANHRATELLGRELPGNNLWVEFPALGDSPGGTNLRRVMQERIPFSFEHLSAAVHKWFEVDCFPTAEGLSIFFRDITSRREGEESIRSSEARYRFLAESMSQYVWTTDESGKVDYANQHFLTFTGQTFAEIQAGKTTELIHPEDRDRVLAIAGESLALRKPYELEYRARRSSDGAYRWFLARCEAFTDAEGKLKWLGTGIDITERKKAADIINENRQQMRMVLDAAQMGAWVWDLKTDEVVDLGNSSEILGVPMLHSFTAFESALHPDDREKVKENITSAIQTGRYDSEFRTVRSDGEIRWFRAIGSVLTDEDGKPTQMAGVNFDVTEKKRIEQALLKSEKLAAVGRLAASVSHEINNPLESVTNLLFLTEREKDDTRQREYIKIAQQELARVTEIAKQTLRFHRQPSHRSTASAGELTDSVLMLFRGRITQAGVNVTTEYASDDMFLCYASEVRQVIANLVSNALDASLAGGNIRIRTKVITSPNLGRSVQVTVADTGRGMNTATQKLIYEPFFTTKESTGTGLGLWVSLEIARKHNGVIRVRSSNDPKNHGTVFTVLFPLETDAAVTSTAAD